MLKEDFGRAREMVSEAEADQEGREPEGGGGRKGTDALVDGCRVGV